LCPKLPILPDSTSGIPAVNVLQHQTEELGCVEVDSGVLSRATDVEDVLGNRENDFSFFVADENPSEFRVGVTPRECGAGALMRINDPGCGEKLGAAPATTLSRILLTKTTRFGEYSRRQMNFPNVGSG